jgi:tight adherence protein C
MNELIQNIATVLVGAIAFTTMMVAWLSLRRKAVRSARLKTVAYRDGLRRQALHRTRRNGGRPAVQLNPIQLIQRMVGDLKLVSVAQREKTKLLLMQAGWRRREGIAVYVFAKLVGPIGGLAGAAAVVWGWQLFQHSPILRVGAVVLGGLIGSMAVDMIIKLQIRRRQKSIKRALPDVLDLLVICAETGLGFDVALTRVAQEFETSSPEMADELSVLEAELTFLPDRAVAFDNLARRTNLPSVSSVVTTILQGERYGTPLSQSLRTLAAEFRIERLLAAEQKAARLPAIMTLPLILFILPCLFIVVVGPAILSTIDTFKHLH